MTATRPQRPLPRPLRRRRRRRERALALLVGGLVVALVAVWRFTPAARRCSIAGSLVELGRVARRVARARPRSSWPSSSARARALPRDAAARGDGARVRPVARARPGPRGALTSAAVGYAIGQARRTSPAPLGGGRPFRAAPGAPAPSRRRHDGRLAARARGQLHARERRRGRDRRSRFATSCWGTPRGCCRGCSRSRCSLTGCGGSDG